MTVPGLPQGTAPSQSVAPPKTGKAAGARRSLLDQDAGAAAGLSAFRRLDLTFQDATTAIGRGGVDTRDQTRTSPGDQARDDRPNPEAGTSGPVDNPTASRDAQRSGLRGLFGALATGRVSLLSGALGFLAQVLGQRTDSVTQTRVNDDGTVVGDVASRDPAARTRDGAQALSRAATSPDGTSNTRIPTELETQNGVRAYDLVNRLVGSPNDVPSGHGVEFTLPLPFGRATTSVDQLA